MRNISVFICALFVVATAHAATPFTRSVELSAHDAVIPGDFSPVNDAFVVVKGFFPNSCYTWDRSDVSSPTPMVHEIHNFADVAQRVACLMVEMPYAQNVNLGHLATGTHIVRVINTDGTMIEKTLTVQPAPTDIAFPN